MGNLKIKVKDLSTTSSLSTNNELMLLTDDANNRVQNITIENALANIISSNANNNLSIGTDKKLYTRDISGEVGDLDNLITTNKTDIVSAINEVKGDTNAITGEVVSASKGWLEEGKIYQKAYWYGEKLYNDVYTYNHSTNITGIDTIKPADYTVVGTPTISADGIASGFTTNNYISIATSNIDLSTANSWEIDFSVILNSSTTSTQMYFDTYEVGNNSNIRFDYYNPNNENAFRLMINSTDNTRIFNYVTIKDNIVINTWYKFKLIYTGTHYIVKDANGNELKNVESSKKVELTSRILLGKRQANDQPLTNGSIDLNSFKIFVDGNLVYQPCLFIPYNESSTGSKIVDVAYRDRVIDTYQQFGSANYYTIDEVNENCTLPMGEIYGFIEKTKENFSVPAYGNQNIGVTITDNLTYTCPDDGYIYCNNIQVTAGGSFDLSISRNSQSSSLISFGGISVDASVQIPFIYPVIKGDVAQILWSSTSGTYPTLYFVPKKGV